MAYLLACAVSSCISFWIIWSPHYPPIIDLPSHVSMLSLFVHYDDPAYGVAEQFDLNWFNPYILWFLVLRAFAFIWSPLGAYKVLLSLGVVASVWRLYHLIKVANGETWWSLWGFPLYFGFAYYFGFVNFLITLPLGLAFIEQSIRFSINPTRRRGIVLPFLGLFVFFGHGIAFGFCSVVTLGVFAVLNLRNRRRWPWIGSLLAPWLVVLLWLPNSGEEVHIRKNIFSYFDWTRVPRLFGFLIETEPDLRAIGIMLGCVLGWLALGGLRFHPRRVFVLPLFLAILAYLFGPEKLMVSQYVSSRLGIFVFFFALIAFVPAESRRLGTIGKAITSLLVVFWLGQAANKTKRFDKEAASFDAIRERVSTMNPHIAALILDTRSEEISGFPYLHYSQWIQADHGGVDAENWARWSHYMPLISKPGKAEELYGSDKHDYDYVIGRNQYRAALNRQLRKWKIWDQMELVANEGKWFLYARKQERKETR